MNNHLNVQVHVGIDEIYSIRISNEDDPHAWEPTIVVGSARDWLWDHRLGNGNGGDHSRIMRQGSDTLESRKLEKLSRSYGDRRTNLDGVEPSGTFIGTDAPPLLPHLGVGASRVGGGEQESGNDCDAEEVKESHGRMRD